MSARAIVTALGVVSAVGASATVASATKPSPEHKVTICHATASAKNPYVVITVDVASIVDGGHGRSGVNIGDIIPPFDIAGYVYPGHNWDEAHQAIAAGRCDGATETATTTTSTTEPPNQ